MHILLHSQSVRKDFRFHFQSTILRRKIFPNIICTCSPCTATTTPSHTRAWTQCWKAWVIFPIQRHAPVSSLCPLNHTQSMYPTLKAMGDPPNRKTCTCFTSPPPPPHHTEHVPDSGSQHKDAHLSIPHPPPWYNSQGWLGIKNLIGIMNYLSILRSHTEHVHDTGSHGRPSQLKNVDLLPPPTSINHTHVPDARSYGSLSQRCAPPPPTKS